MNNKQTILAMIDVVATIAEMMQKYHPRYIIYAPVQTSTHGDQLVEPQVFSAIKEQIIPLCTIVLEPSDLPSAIRLHGQANQLSAALAYYLSCGENTNEAMLHARTYLSQFPKSSPLQRRCFLCRAVGCQRPLSGTGNTACRQPFTQVYHRRTHHGRDFHDARHQQTAKGDCRPVGILFTGSSLALLQEADGQGSQ